MVKWKGFDDSENTWEAASDIIDQGFAGQIETYENAGLEKRNGRQEKKSTFEKGNTEEEEIKGTFKTPAEDLPERKRDPIFTPSGSQSTTTSSNEPEEEEEVVANEEEAVTSTNDKSNDMVPVSSYGDVASWSAYKRRNDSRRSGRWYSSLCLEECFGVRSIYRKEILRLSLW